jgi:PAS domain-containing protein
VSTSAPVCLTYTTSPDELTDITIAAVQRSESELPALLEPLPMPIYLTDAEGWITYFNRACVDFAGRTPVPGQDRWCVSWRLYTEGGACLPHEECPMAVAILERRPVRGAVAVAERPDGTRVLFSPWPTPIFDEAGRLAGAVNILVDITDRRQADALKAQALRCRRLAQSVSNPQTVRTLNLMAADYESKARDLDKA